MQRLRTPGLAKLIGLVALAVAACAAPASAQVVAPTGGLVPGGPTTPAAGAPGAGVPQTPLVPGAVAQVIRTGPLKGLASPPQLAPAPVQNAIWAANQIIGKPYKYGGGHGSFRLASGYDCSSTVSWALNGAGVGLLQTPLDSRRFMKWGEKGPGQWFTVYTNPDHAYLEVAGIRLDTSAAEDRGGRKGPRWRPLRTKSKGFRIRHPLGY